MIILSPFSLWLLLGPQASPAGEFRSNCLSTAGCYLLVMSSIVGDGCGATAGVSRARVVCHEDGGMGCVRGVSRARKGVTKYNVHVLSRDSLRALAPSGSE